MTTLALIASPGKIRALKIGLVRHLKNKVCVSKFSFNSVLIGLQFIAQVVQLPIEFVALQCWMVTIFLVFSVPVEMPKNGER